MSDSYDAIVSPKLVEGDIMATHPHVLVEDHPVIEKSHILLSEFIHATANFSAQYNFQSIAIALIVMSTVQCTTGQFHCIRH
jgi:hypothetical protein